MTPELFLSDPLMPKPVNCERCGAPSVVHAVQYVYKDSTGESGEREHVLTSVIAVIECPECGVHTQTTDIENSAN